MLVIIFIVICWLLLWKKRNNQAQQLNYTNYTNHAKWKSSKLATRYPTFFKKIQMHMEAFDSIYKQTFDMSRTSVNTIMKLFLERERVLHAINDIRFLLPNDLDDEIVVARLHDDVDRSLMENIRDAKERLHVFFTPGPMSTASEAINYRAANDIVV